MQIWGILCNSYSFEACSLYKVCNDVPWNHMAPCLDGKHFWSIYFWNLLYRTQGQYIESMQVMHVFLVQIVRLSSIIMIVFIFIFIFRMDKISCLCVFKVLMLVINCQLICQVKLIHLCHIHVFVCETAW